jgi:hypothetical protein
MPIYLAIYRAGTEMATNPKYPPGPPMTLGNMREMSDRDGYVL